MFNFYIFVRDIFVNVIFINLNQNFIIMSKINSLAISDNGFIFKPETGESFTTNELGLLIISQLKKDKSNEEIVNYITEEFEVDEISAGRDLYEFLDFLKQENLVD